MYHRFRPAFTPQDGKVTLVAQSTTVPRSMASMAAFVAEMRGYTPTAEFSMDPSNGYDNTLRFFKGKEYQQYLSKGSWKKILRAYQEKHTPTRLRLIDRIFKKGWEQIIPDPITFMTHLYALTIILPFPSIAACDVTNMSFNRGFAMATGSPFPGMELALRRYCDRLFALHKSNFSSSVNHGYRDMS